MVEINEIDFRYRRGTNLFNSLSLYAEPGNIYGLLGRNGAGKTTLLRLLSGLIFPDRGMITMKGVDPKERKAETMGDIFFLPEEPFLPKITGQRYADLYAPLYPGFSEEAFQQYIDMFSFDLQARLPEQSYGQRKKFLLSFALATGCSLLLLDEPTNGLDIPAKRIFRKILSGSIDEGRTYIIATHQVRDMEHLIDPVIILEDARVVFNRSSREISSSLAVRLAETEPEEQAAYVEKVFGGYTALVRNTDGRETEIDIEFLFNAVTENPEAVNALFEGGTNE